MGFLFVVFSCLLGLAAVIIILAAIPLSYDCSGSWRDSQRTAAVKVRYGPLLLRYRYDCEKDRPHQAAVSLFGIGRNIAPDPGGEKAKKKTKEKTKEKSGLSKTAALGFHDIRNMLGKDLLVAAGRLIQAIYRHSSPKYWDFRGVVGFEDPYYTGLLAATAQLWSITRLEPDFTREIYDFSAEIRGRIVVLILIVHVVRFLLSNAGRRVLAALRRAKRKRNKGGAFVGAG